MLTDRQKKQAQVKQNRQRVIAYLLKNPCAQCKEPDPIVLDFHHVRDKVEDISKMVSQGLPWAKIRAEIEKTVIYCANCHRRIHAEKDNTWKWQMLNKKR